MEKWDKVRNGKETCCSCLYAISNGCDSECWLNINIIIPIEIASFCMWYYPIAFIRSNIIKEQGFYNNQNKDNRKCQEEE